MFQRDPEHSSPSLELHSPQHFWKGGQADCEHIAQIQIPVFQLSGFFRLHSRFHLDFVVYNQLWMFLQLSKVVLFLNCCKGMRDFALRALKHLQLPLKSPLEAASLSARGSIIGHGQGKEQCVLPSSSANASSRARDPSVTWLFVSMFDFTS